MTLDIPTQIGPTRIGAAARGWFPRGGLLPALFLHVLFAAVVLAAAPLAAQTAATAPPAASTEMGPLGAPLDPAQAKQLLSVLQDATRRQALLDQLRVLADNPSAAAASPARAAPPASPSPAAKTAPAKAASLPAKTLVPGSLGEQLVAQTSRWLDTLSTEAAATVRAVTGFSAMVRWVRYAAVDQALRARLTDAVSKSALILGVSLLAFFAVRRLLRRFMRALDRAGTRESDGPAPDETVLSEAHPRVRAARSIRLLRRLPAAILRAVLAFLPAVGFAAAAYLLLGAGLVALFTTKMIVIQAATSFEWFWAVVCLARLLFTDRIARWRLVDLGDRFAAYFDPWVRWLAGIAIFGGMVAAIGGRLGWTPAAQDGLIKIVALAVNVGLVAIVWRSRRLVARKLRPRPGWSPLWTTVGTQFAERWHWLATVLILGLWVFSAVQAQAGLQRVLRLTGVTILVLIGFRVVSIAALGALDRLFRVNGSGARPLPGFGQRAQRYHPVLRQLVTAVVAFAALIVLLQSWGLHALLWFSAGAIGGRILGALGGVLIVVLVALVAWELANAALDRHLHRLSANGLAAQAGRLRTLAPLLRTCLLSAILVFVVLTALSEIGVNIAPLLAGAGIFGVALGFGSQKLVQDFITGIFLLLENAMQVGEWVTVSGLSGTVENLSVRTIRLRAGDGSVHVIPFSSVTTVTNTNRGIGNAAVSVVVSSDEDTDAVGAALKQIAAEMRADPDYTRGIRSDLALWGVDKVDASTVTIVGQIECTDSARWGVQREFNRRVKRRFQELGIRLANPAQAVLLQHPGRTRAELGLDVMRRDSGPRGPDDSQASETHSPPPAALGHTQ